MTLPTSDQITVTRTHEIAVGHRVYGHESKCAFLHGHNYTFELTCSAPLDALGRVIDFGVIKTTLCAWLEDTLDHQMVLRADDPLVPVLRGAGQLVYTMAANPTAENLAAYVGSVIGPRVLPIPVECIAVKVWETGKCSATWTRGGA